MGHDEDIQKLKTDVDNLNKSGQIQNKAREYQPLIWILIMFVGAILGWSNLKSLAELNQREINRFDGDIKDAKYYTETKFKELKVILDDYKRKQDLTHDQVLLLKEQNRYTRQEVANNNELLKQLLNKINTGR